MRESQPVPMGESANGTVPPEITTQQLDEEIQLLEGGAFCWLRFAPGLETQLETFSAAHRSRRFWMQGIICILVFDFFLISDYLTAPSDFMQFVVIRLGFATPPAMLAVIVLRHGVKRALREGMVVFICAIFGLSSLYLYFNVSPVVSSYTITAMAILVLFTNIGLRIRLPYAIFAATMCLTFSGIYLIAESTLKNAEKFESLTILLAAVVLSVAGNYSLERGERLNFLHHLRNDAKFGALAVMNDQLRSLVWQDKLTGLANRGHFDETYIRLWNESVARGSCLSVIMIDIDNFKALNDTYGHPYGDAVLQRVSSLLKEALRKEEDFVARYGGEEFIVLLPDATEKVGLRVAERIRLLIEVAGSPAVAQPSSSGHGWGTVSCGMATSWPRKDLPREALIQQADFALYQAKLRGRNRVCVAVAA